MVTECSMADNVQAELPDVEFVRPCNLCPHMKRITLPKILDSLVYMKEEVMIDPVIAEQGAALGRAHDQSEELTVTSRRGSERARRGVLAKIKRIGSALRGRSTATVDLPHAPTPSSRRWKSTTP